MLFYVKNQAGYAVAHLYDAQGAAITTGTVTVTLAGSPTGSYAGGLTNSPVHSSDGKWSILLTAAENNNDYRFTRWAHDDLLAPMFVADQAASSVGLAQEATLADIVGAAGGEGAYTGTLTVDDGDGTGLEGAVVHAYRGGVLIASGTTDSSGEITNWVFGGYTYDLAVRLAGYQPATDTITVTGDVWTKTISMTAISITAPGDATLCTIQFRVKISATAVEGAVCKAKLLGTNQASDGTILSNAESSDTTDSEGIAELQLVQKGSIVKGGGRYRIWVEIAGNTIASVETTIPNQSTVLFEDML